MARFAISGQTSPTDWEIAKEDPHMRCLTACLAKGSRTIDGKSIRFKQTLTAEDQIPAVSGNTPEAQEKPRLIKEMACC